MKTPCKKPCKLIRCIEFKGAFLKKFVVVGEHLAMCEEKILEEVEGTQEEACNKCDHVLDIENVRRITAMAQRKSAKSSCVIYR